MTQAKRVLAISYSQTGQLRRISDQILAPLLVDPAIRVHQEQLQPLPAYPFPWPFFRFFDAFPESAHMVAPELAPLSLSADDEFDLVIIFYQVWFLSPSLPTTGFLKHPLASRLLQGKPVITVIGCRNMWLMAQEKMKKLIAGAGGRLIDNVVLMDKSPMAATFVTTPRWFLTGRQDAFWGMPAAGIAEGDIQRASRFGRALVDGLHANLEKTGQPLLSGLQAVEANPHLLVSEKAGTRGFLLWGALIRLLGRPGAALRKPVLALYVLFLFGIIVTVVPVSLSLQALARPLLRGKLAALKAGFEQPSGSGHERMALYDR